MKKNILIIIAAIILFSVLAIILFRQNNNGADTADPSSEGEPQTSGASIAPNQKFDLGITVPAGETIAIGTAGGAVVVKNFYKNAVAVLDYDLIIKKTAEYILDYSLADSSFAVTVLKLPASQYQKSAEADLLGILGVGEKDACRLNILVFTPYDGTGGGTKHSLSFCAAGIQ